MTRVVHFSYDSVCNPWVGGGGAVRLHEIYKRLTGKYEITVIAGTFAKPGEQVIDGVRYVFMGLAWGYFISRLTYCLLALAMSLLGFFFLRKYDLVVVDFDPFTFYLPLFKRRRTTLIIHHLFDRDLIRRHGLGGYPPYWFEVLVPGLYRNIIFVSESVRQRRVFQNVRTTIIYNGIDSDLFELAAEEHNYLLALGRIAIHNKGLDVLVSAFKQLHARAPELSLIIAGDGKDLPALREMIREAGLEGVIQTPGRVSAAQKRDLLRQCLFVVMPSRYEGWGIVAIEAAACGKAIVGADIDGLRDSIVKDQTGLLSERDNSADLYEKMLRLAEDRNLRQRLGTQGRERARQFLWENIAREQDRFFASLLRPDTALAGEPRSAESAPPGPRP